MGWAYDEHCKNSVKQNCEFEMCSIAAALIPSIYLAMKMLIWGCTRRRAKAQELGKRHDALEHSKREEDKASKAKEA